MLLCFLTNTFTKLTDIQLKPVLISFYNEEELCSNKEVLQNLLVDIVLSMWNCHTFQSGRVKINANDTGHSEMASELNSSCCIPLSTVDCKCLCIPSRNAEDSK